MSVGVLASDVCFAIVSCTPAHQRLAQREGQIVIRAEALEQQELLSQKQQEKLEALQSELDAKEEALARGQQQILEYAAKKVMLGESQ